MKISEIIEGLDLVVEMTKLHADGPLSENDEYVIESCSEAIKILDKIRITSGAIISSEKLKNHYSWWSIGSDTYVEFKQIFDDIIDAQPSIIDIE